MIGLIIIFLYSLNFNLGTFGLVSFIIAFFGTCLVIGDVWFGIFVTPIIEEPGPKDIPPPSMMAGAVLTFFSFSVGLILFGFCLFRRNVFPKWLCILFIMGAIFGQKVLTIPYIIVLATVVMVMNLRIYNEYKVTIKKREEPPITPKAFL